MTVYHLFSWKPKISNLLTVILNQIQVNLFMYKTRFGKSLINTKQRILDENNNKSPWSLITETLKNQQKEHTLALIDSSNKMLADLISRWITGGTAWSKILKLSLTQIAFGHLPISKWKILGCILCYIYLCASYAISIFVHPT